ncbi:hypothetical protein PG993_005549 [Apiospora rasikravindrae]|uniref:DUF6594 domain-containing protein n=1 Tax=Apiospora rasikravindrae TaxID=990691 RepID=A0ABR1TFW0_9PEZI
MDMPRQAPITEDMSYEQRLLQHTINTGRLEPHFMTFRGLQRLNIIRLQNDIAQIKRSAWDDKQITRAQSEELTKLLHDYTNAIKDYEYLSKLVPVTGSVAKHQRLDLEQAFEEVGTLHDDPGGYRRLPDTTLLPSDPLRDALKRQLPNARWAGARPEYLSGREPPEEVSSFVDKLARFIVAFVGGTALVVPMLIMRLPDVTLTKSLVTVSVAVLLFAAALSVGLRASNTETMVSTATYAAVLVVFVGTTTP